MEMAASIAKSIDVEAYERFLENPERNTDYWMIRKSLNEAKQHTAALYVYTLSFDDPNSRPKVMIAGFPSDDRNYYDIGMDCLVPLDQIKEAYAGKPYFTGKISDPHYTEYISAGAPIVNKAGETIGFLSIDIETTMLDRIDHTVVKNSTPGFILSGLLIIVLVSSFMLIQKWYNHELKKQVGDTEETYHSELHSLIQSVRSLRHDFANHIQVLNGLLKLGKQQEAIDYSNSMREEAQLLYKIPIQSNNPALSVLFQTKSLSAQSHNINIQFHHSNASFELIQPTDLVKILSNLIDNAIDATKEISKENRSIEVYCEKRNHEYIFRVTNSGSEISQEELTKIFIPGYSTKSGENTDKQVRGQGLYIVKQIVEKYNGRIIVESLNRKTSFEVRVRV
ncbi:sensor histidine kinase [Metabacillus litoralis]|uniref:sensor histidine kinase n=1 Tax=Metabacillus litoralis TaxID=152268 RepID=UPI00203EE8C8|nr:ATP-binding protein [Metabacillus litoralis]MCM3164851.1 GHKL domain-containing protein [Metabacillus litoralis]